jgi:hypothetical protein
VVSVSAFHCHGELGEWWRHGRTPPSGCMFQTFTRTQDYRVIILQDILRRKADQFETLRAAKSASARTQSHGEKVKLSLCLTNWALRHEEVWESGCIGPRVLDLGTGWWVVSFTTLLLYPRCSLDRLDGTLLQVWTIWRSENSWFYRDSNSDLSVVQPLGSRYTDYATAALQSHGINNLMFINRCPTFCGL